MDRVVSDRTNVEIASGTVTALKAKCWKYKKKKKHLNISWEESMRQNPHVYIEEHIKIDQMEK